MTAMSTVDPPATATDRAYAFAKSGILEGRFAGGDLISEGDVAAQVGLSRTPVREAFLRLESEGLLRLYPKRGALVVPVSAAEIEDVMETRLLVERFAIEKIGRASDALVAELEASIARQERFARRGDARAFVEADREFHRLLVAETRNDVLIALHDSLRDRQARMGLAALSAVADRVREIGEEHRALVAALAAGEPAASELLVAHLQRTLALLRRERTLG
jgi:DNA-binding GntR family transcriptional regulator